MNFIVGYILGRNGGASSAGAGIAGIFVLGIIAVVMMGVLMPAYLAIHLGALAGGDSLNPIILLLIVAAVLWLVWPFYLMSMFAPTKQSIVGVAFLIAINAFVLGTSSLTPGTPIDNFVGDGDSNDLFNIFVTLNICVVGFFLVARFLLRRSLGKEACSDIYLKYSRGHRRAGGAAFTAISNISNSLGLWILLSVVVVLFGTSFAFFVMADINKSNWFIEQNIETSGRDSDLIQYYYQSIKEGYLTIFAIVVVMIAFLGNVARIVILRRSKR